MSCSNVCQLQCLLVQVLLAAGDTFRAAAAEQLQGWAVRSQVEVHAASRENARPDNVLYEAVDKVSQFLHNSCKLWTDATLCLTVLQQHAHQAGLS